MGHFGGNIGWSCRNLVVHCQWDGCPSHAIHPHYHWWKCLVWDNTWILCIARSPHLPRMVGCATHCRRDCPCRDRSRWRWERSLKEKKKQKHAVRGRIVYSYVRRAKGERRGVTGERLAPNQRIAQHIHTQRPTNAPKKKRHRRVSYPPTSFSPSVWPEEAVTLGWGDRRGV